MQITWQCLFDHWSCLLLNPLIQLSITWAQASCSSYIRNIISPRHTLIHMRGRSWSYMMIWTIMCWQHHTTCQHVWTTTCGCCQVYAALAACCSVYGREGALSQPSSAELLVMRTALRAIIDEHFTLVRWRLCELWCKECVSELMLPNCGNTKRI